MTPYSRPKLFDFYTISQTELLENHTCHSGTCLLLYPVYGTIPTRVSYALHTDMKDQNKTHTYFSISGGESGSIFSSNTVQQKILPLICTII